MTIEISTDGGIVVSVSADPSIAVEVVSDPDTIVVTVPAEQGPPGPPGPRGETGGVGLEKSISADAGNAMRPGSDAKLFVPDDIASDPLAYYILARN